MTFTLKSSKNDPVKIYVSEDGSYKIVKRPSKSTYTLMGNFSIFNIMGEVIGEFNTLEEAMNI